MAKTLYLHIGFDKTGTTSIQHALVKQRAVLQRHGFGCFHRRYNNVGHYPVGAVNDWINVDLSPETAHHHGIAFTERLEQLFAQAATLPQDKVILSAERFSCFFNVGEIEKIRTAVEKHFSHCHIIAYIRRQDKLMVSLYQEYSKQATDPFDGARALPTFAYKPFAYLDFNQRFLQWEQVFGQENIHVRVFEPTALVGGDAVTDFFHLLGIDEPISGEKHNESNGFERTKIGHLLKQHVDSPYWHRYILAYLDNSGKLLPSRGEAEAVYQLYQTSNQQLNQRYGLSTTPAIFDEDFSAYPNEPADQWNEETANQAIGNIFNAFNQLSVVDVALISLKTKLSKYHVVRGLWRLFRAIIRR